MRIRKEDAVGLVIDIQERLLPHIYENSQVIERCKILLQGLNALEIPVLITEQYKKGLGLTVEEIANLVDLDTSVEKIAFSCCGEEGFMAQLQNKNKKRVIICGIETHVCVLQTSLDLLEAGYTPVVVEDCVSSRNPRDKAIALERLSQEGAIITSSESILFELTEKAGSEVFKTISKLVK